MSHSTPTPDKAAQRTADATAAEPGRPVVRIAQLHKSYDGNRVLRGIDADVHRGEVLCLIGPSGSGKSTLLRCVAQLETPDAGVIAVDDELLGVRLHRGRLHRLPPAAARRQRAEVGMVFQHFNLFAHLTVLENIIEAPARVRGQSRQEAVAAADALLARVGLAGRRDSYPSQLSGGQQQRVAIARALAMNPKVMLFDEPTSALDPELVGEVLDVLTELAASGMTMIVATHEMNFARDVADRVVFLDQGLIVEAGPAHQVITAPEQARTQEFLRRLA
ncbi:amino acid ABC transporter ATP-binding protein [Streptomyces bobili]